MCWHHTLIQYIFVRLKRKTCKARSYHIVFTTFKEYSATLKCLLVNPYHKHVF